MLIDYALIMSVLIILMIVTDSSANRTSIMVTSIVILLLTYEPLLTAYSQTIGQRTVGIKVGKLDDPQQKINLLNAYLRWITKSLLGWLSFITIHFNEERRAIHDMVAGSVMIDEK